MSSEPVQGLQLPEPVVLISQKSLSDVYIVEEMEVEDNTLVISPELTDDMMSNFQLMYEMDRATNSRNDGLLIEDEEQEISDVEEEEMPAVEPEEVEEGEEVDSLEDCRILSSSDSKSLISEQSTIDGSRRAHQQRGSAASKTTVNAPVSSLSIIIDEKEKEGKGMFDVGDSDNMEPRRWRAEETLEKTEHHSRCRSHRSGHEFEERHYESQSRSSIRCSPPHHGESDTCC